MKLKRFINRIDFCKVFSRWRYYKQGDRLPSVQLLKNVLSKSACLLMSMAARCQCQELFKLALHTLVYQSNVSVMKRY